MSLLSGIKTLDDLDLENQRVFVRADLDAHLSKAGEILDDSLIRKAVPTLRKLLESGARVIVGSRYGEMRGGHGSLRADRAPSIEPAAALLAEHLQAEVLLPDGCTGDSVKKVISSLREGQICVLENLAQADDVGPQAEAFARQLFDLVDMFVGDAPRLLQLESATTTILPRLFERRMAGLSLMSELEAVARIRLGQDRPRLLVWGGNSLSERLPLLHKLLGPQDRVFLVGVPANTVIRATGGFVGRSTFEEPYLAGARTLEGQLGDRLILPTDFLVAESTKSTSPRVAVADQLNPTEMALDLGPQSLQTLEEQIEKAQAVIWCGTVGFHRNETFAQGTQTLLTALARSSAFTLVVGEDSVSAANTLGAEHLASIDCVASGGAATLALLSESKLAGLEALRGISHDATHSTDRR